MADGIMTQAEESRLRDRLELGLLRHIPKADGYAVCDPGEITPQSQCRLHPLNAAEFAAPGQRPYDFASIVVV